KTGAEQIDLTTGQAEYFDYHGSAESLAPSYKHNHVFVATENGIDLLYLNLGGRTPYTIPLDGEPTAMVMAGSGTRIYAAIAGRRLVDVVDTEQYAVVDRIVTDVFPTSLAISPREDTLYVGSANGAEAVTIRDRSVVCSAESAQPPSRPSSWCSISRPRSACGTTPHFKGSPSSYRYSTSPP